MYVIPICRSFFRHFVPNLRHIILSFGISPIPSTCRLFNDIQSSDVISEPCGTMLEFIIRSSIFANAIPNLIAQGEDEMRALHSGRRKAVVPRNPDLRFNSTTKTWKPSTIRWCRVFQG
ncbi:hypothetical protein BHE74_00045146 [Ensete ventricosum]|nr:hypothetical protein BHE74_00045146 [Ensete ventricosum]